MTHPASRRTILHDVNSDRPGPYLCRTVEIDDPGALELLPSGRPEWTAWLRRGDGLVGLGTLARLDQAVGAESWWQALCSRMDVVDEVGLPGTGPVAFGSFVFDPAHTADHSRLVVPRAVVGRRNGRAWLTRIAPAGEPVEPADALLRVAGSGPTSVDAPTVTSVTPASLERADWQAAVAEALGRFDDTFTKVVLARAVDAQASGPIEARTLVASLAGRYPTCWTYHVDGLVGASPELLIRRDQGLATSRVLAGTIRRHGDDEVDRALAQALARSSKNLTEHELAVASVAAALAPFCSGMNVPEAPSVLELPNVFHLATDITGVAHGEASALSLATALHPSAAVCGTPADVARATIAELEHLDRGRYAGPVGWMDAAGDGEFAIALRCGQVDPNDARHILLYAGCGIVAESDPADEYAETLAKLVPMLEALGL